MSIFAHPTPSGPSGHLPLIGGVGPGPHYGGRIPASPSKISGAQNLSDALNSRRATGPWVCGKLELVRFRFCACRFRTNVPGLFSAVGAHSVRPQAAEVVGPYGKTGEFPVFRRGGPMWPPAGRSGTGPYENNTVAPISAVGAGPRPARKAFPWGPTPLVKGRWPKARGDREGEYGHGVSILSRPPAILWVLSHRWERTSPPAGGEISPVQKRSPSRRNSQNQSCGSLRQPGGETKFRTKFFCLLFFPRKAGQLKRFMARSAPSFRMHSTASAARFTASSMTFLSSPWNLPSTQSARS